MAGVAKLSDIIARGTPAIAVLGVGLAHPHFVKHRSLDAENLRDLLAGAGVTSDTHNIVAKASRVSPG